MMKSKKSSSNISIVIKENFKRIWPMILISSLMMLTLSMVILLRMNTEFYEAPNLRELLLMYTPAFVIMGIVIGQLIFNYMQKKGESNFMHSLPITRKNIFCGEFLSGFLIMLLPIVLTSLLLLYITGWNFKLVIEWSLFSTLGTLNIYAITVISGLFSGNVLMHIFNSVFFNVAAPIIVMEVNSIFKKLLFGYSTGTSYEDILVNSNVLSALVSDITIPVVCGYIVFTALLIVGSYFLYAKRKIEKTGESLMFNWLKVLIMVLATFIFMIMLGLMISLNIGRGVLMKGLYIGIIIGFFAGYSIMWVLIYRSTRIFSKKSLKIMLPMALLFTVIIGGIHMDVLGYSNVNVPLKKVNMSGVTLFQKYNGDTEEEKRFHPKAFKNMKMDPDINLDDTADYYDSSAWDYMPYWESEGNIKAVNKIHDLIIAEKNIHKNEVEKYRVGLSIRGKDNSVLRRVYVLSSKGLKEKISNECAKIYESKEFKDKYQLKNLKYKIDGIDFYKSKDEEKLKEISWGKIEGLIAALDKDFVKRSYKEQNHNLNNDSKKSYFEIKFLNGSEEDDTTTIRVNVSKNDKNTLAWIKANLK